MQSLKLFLVVAVSLLSKFNKAQTIQKSIDTKIENATVFLNGAQINRTGKTIIPVGKSEVVFKNISPYINKQSIQLKSTGNFTILSVVHKLNYLQEQAKQIDVQKIEEQKEILLDRLNLQNDMLLVYQNEENLLAKNQAIVAQNTGLKTIDLKDAADFHRQRLTELKIKESEINKTLKKINAEILKLNKQHNELDKQASIATSEIVVTVQSNENANADFLLSYFVDKAGWYPTYDIKVKDILHPLTMAYKANVYQATGEDWKEVKLTLTTAIPNQSGEIPILPTWYLHYFSPQNYNAGNENHNYFNPNIRQVSGQVTDEKGNPIPYCTIIIKDTKTGTATDASGRYTLTIPINASTLVFNSVGMQSKQFFISATVMNIALQHSNESLQEVVVTGYGTKKFADDYGDENDFKKAKKETSIPLTISERENLINFSYDIEMPYTIANDGKINTVEIKEIDIPVLYEYYCIPKLDQDVFLTAKIIDWSNLNLIPGESNLFFEGTYLGKAFINPKTVGDTLSISLGRDKNIVIKRNSIKEFSKKQFLGTNKVDYKNIEIVIRNNKKQPVNLIIEDQYPISTMKEIEVDRIENKDAEIETETGKLKWIVQLDTGKEKKLNFKYSVKYPKANILILE